MNLIEQQLRINDEFVEKSDCFCSLAPLCVGVDSPLENRLKQLYIGIALPESIERSLKQLTIAISTKYLKQNAYIP